MILRIYRAKAAAADRGLLLAHLRDRVYPANIRTPGLRTFQAGMAELPDGSLELVLVSTWQDFDALREGLGRDWLRPVWLADIAHALEPESADHYELVGEELAGIVPLAGAELRILGGRLADGNGEAFFEFARRAQAAQLDAGDILVSHIGRRMVDAGEDAVYVTVWRDEEAALAAGGSPSAPADREGWEPYFASWSFAAFDALAKVAPRQGESQVVLLADDGGRYLYASPAAGRLLGRPPARLLGHRVAELAGPRYRGDVDALWQAFLRDGVQAGPFELARADGTTTTVRYEAHANTPWPGVHASVLSDPARPVEFDDALAAEGIVARYMVGAGG